MGRRLLDQVSFYLALPIFLLACLSGGGIVIYTVLGVPSKTLVQGFVHLPTPPPTKTITVEFSEHDEYKNLSRDYDHLWEELLTPNGGFIIYKDTEHTLHRYGLSMFHQLHCLGMIRGAMQAALGIQGSYSVLRSRHTDESVDMHPSDDDHGDPAHWLHCFDYLRQTILCQGDSTIEPPKRDTHGDELVDGMGERQCRDWTVLRAASIRSDSEL